MTLDRIDQEGTLHEVPPRRTTPVLPTPGRIVLYRLTSEDAAQVNRRRDDATRNLVHTRHAGVQAHAGNRATAGDVVPMIVVRVWPDEFGPGIPGVNGQAILDGSDSLWVCSAREGTAPGEWHWPPRS